MGLLGLTRSAMTRALVRSWWSISSFFDASTLPNWVTPVMLPPGRLRLDTSPSRTGSMLISKTIGILAVAAFAASAAGVDVAAITATCRRTRSAAIAGRRSPRASAHRYSMALPGASANTVCRTTVIRNTRTGDQDAEDEVSAGHGHLSRAYASRYQLARSHVLLSHPVSSATSWCFRPATPGRATIGITT